MKFLLCVKRGAIKWYTELKKKNPATQELKF